MSSVQAIVISIQLHNRTESQTTELTQIVLNRALSNFIRQHLSSGQYYVVFDELDEDYRDILNPDRKDGYFELLISLFKAVQNIRAEFSDFQENLRIIIFLRDDIFDLCRDVDKNKWLDRAIVLRWDEAKLRNLTKFRLSQACRLTGSPVELDQAWSKAFSVSSTRFGTRGFKTTDTFKFIAGRGFLRPRDIISYTRECASSALSAGHNRINNQDIKMAGDEHSAYMRREIIDEVFPVLEDISEVLDVLSRIRKQIFNRKEFNDRYREYQNSISAGERSKLSESQVLKILYHFNVLGNVTSGNRRSFAYNSNVKVLNTDEPLCVHNGLLRSLDIY